MTKTIRKSREETSLQRLDVELDRPLPQMPDAERTILGAVLVNHKVLARVRHTLTEDDFYKDAHRTIYRAMCILDDGADAIELVPLIDCLQSRGEIELVGGAAYLMSLLEFHADIANIEKYAKIVRKKSRLRRILIAASKVMRGSLEPDADPDELIAQFELEIADLGRGGSMSRDLATVVDDAIRAADTRKERGELLGIRTSLQCVNENLLGYQRGALTVLAANTSVGKTAFGLQVAEDAVRGSKLVRATTYQAEMTAQAVAYRFLARNTRISLPVIRQWDLDANFDRPRIAKYQAKLTDFQGRLTVASELRTLPAIIADMKRRKAEDGLDLAVIDYLQLIDPATDEATREREVSHIAWRLVEVAQDLNVAVLALSQVTSNGGRLTAESLRESKAIGHHARTVLILDRPRQTNKDDTTYPKCYVNFQIEKQSEGDTGDFELHFDGRYQLFTEGGCPTGCPFTATGKTKEEL